MGACCGKQSNEEQEENHLLQEIKQPTTTSKPFTAIAYNVLCTLCDQPIPSMFETAKDSRGRPYHAKCCRCARCGRALSGETVNVREKKAFCRMHATPERTADVASSPAGDRTSVAESVKLETAHVDVADLCESMIDRIVIMPPTCASCGGIFGPKDEVRCLGMIKLHSDCLIGRPGAGRTAAVAKKTPLQMAKNAAEFLAVRVVISSESAAPSIHTFFLSRNNTAFDEIITMRVGAHGSAPVLVPYDAVSNKHLSTTKRGVPDGTLEVVDVAGNFLASLDQMVTVDGITTAVLVRVESGTRSLLRLLLEYLPTQQRLSFRGGSVLYEERAEEA